VSPRIPVVAELPEYRVAVAGLPERAQHVDRTAGAIVVVEGAAGWWDAAAIAVEAGASAVLVAEPREVPLEPVADLAARSEVPVIVHRSCLREDLVALGVEQRGGVAPRLIVAECRAAAGALPVMVRDGVGWMRALAHDGLAVAAASFASGTGTALLRSRVGGRVVGSMVVALTRSEGTVLRVQALGEVTTEVEIDAPLGRSELATSTSGGRLVAPARFETGERAALRRAVDAVTQRRSSPDLEFLLHDAEVTSAILRSAGPGDL
jgi:hypothetical protein